MIFQNARTTALDKVQSLFENKKFHKIVQGGMSAGKTYAILVVLISYAQLNPESLTTVVGLSYPHLKKGAVRDFQSIMKRAGIYDESLWNETSLMYSFRNGAAIEFASVDKMGSRGLRRDVLFVNEANGIPWEIYEQLANRTRVFSIIDYNPSAEFWAHTELLRNFEDDAGFLILTYKDNEALSSREKKNIENHAPRPGDPPSNWWRVYGMGLVGSLEGNVYSGWRPVPEDFEWGSAKLIRYGLDFGFSNDETALVAIWETEAGEFIVEELIYKTGMLGREYPAALTEVGVDPETLIVADGARPEIIAEITRAGYSCIAAEKGPGSVIRGIDRVKAKTIFYKGENIRREFLSYAWRKKRSGEILDVPEDGNDHLMDAIRYAIDDLNRPRFDF